MLFARTSDRECLMVEPWIRCTRMCADRVVLLCYETHHKDIALDIGIKVDGPLKIEWLRIEIVQPRESGAQFLVRATAIESRPCHRLIAEIELCEVIVHCTSAYRLDERIPTRIADRQRIWMGQARCDSRSRRCSSDKTAVAGKFQGIV